MNEVWGRNLPRGEEADAYWMSRGVLEDLKLGTGLLWCTSSVCRIGRETRVSWCVPHVPGQVLIT